MKRTLSNFYLIVQNYRFLEIKLVYSAILIKGRYQEAINELNYLVAITQHMVKRSIARSECDLCEISPDGSPTCIDLR